MATHATKSSLSNSSSDSSSNLNDSNDLEYEQSDSPSLASNAIYTTPLKRALVNSLPQYIKNEIDKITCNDRRLAMKRCIIENIEEINAVQYAHLLSRSTDDSIISSLEYSWGLRPRHLNVDSRFNVIRINSRLHHAFDRGHWLLLPRSKVLKRFLEHKQRGPKNNDFMEILKDDGPFQYTLVASSKMKAIPIHRQVDSSNRPIIPKAIHFSHHSYPFHTFPKIISHVHPRYVIFNAGEKIASGRTYDLRYKKKLNAVKAIYEAWTQPAPLSGLWGISYDDEEGEDEPKNEEEDKESHASYHTRWDAQSDDGNGLHTGSPPSKRGRKVMEKGDGSTRTLVEIYEASQSLSPEEKKFRIISWVEDVARNDNEARCMVLDGPAAIEDFPLRDNFTLLIGILANVWHFILGIPIILHTPAQRPVLGDADYVDRVNTKTIVL